LEQSDFDVFVGYCGDPSQLPRSPRVSWHSLDGRIAGPQRPYRFLLKFEALADCLARGDHDFLIQMDADAVLARRLNERTVKRAIGGSGLAMVAQEAITGSKMARTDFLRHYTTYALPVIAPGSKAPALEAFRYFNSGIVIGDRKLWTELVAWARNHIAGSVGRHEVGAHIVADQDYFQVWANNVRPNSCRQLPWFWNHCEHWDDRFPRLGVLFAHFSNFCNGPTDRTMRRMRRMRRPPSVWINSLASHFFRPRDA
jgi:hypothetical protein